MSEGEPGDGLRVELWLRDPSLLSDDPRNATLARLRAFERAGVVEDFSVRVWGRYATPPEGPDDWGEATVQMRLVEFRAWAKRIGHSLEPAFQRVERKTLASDATTEAIRLPLQCLAVYHGDEVAGVFPCSTAEGTATVEDCLERLERGEFIPDRITE